MSTGRVRGCASMDPKQQLVDDGGRATKGGLDGGGGFYFACRLPREIVDVFVCLPYLICGELNH